MRSYLDNPKQYDSYNNSLSDTKTIYCGVAQGSVLGPLLFLLYINDLPNVCRQILVELFADDCAWYTTNKTRNQQQVNTDTSNVENWFLEIKLAINKDKNATIEFNRKKFSNKRSHKYLGLSP